MVRQARQFERSLRVDVIDEFVAGGKRRQFARKMVGVRADAANQPVRKVPQIDADFHGPATSPGAARPAMRRMAGACASSSARSSGESERNQKIAA